MWNMKNFICIILFTIFFSTTGLAEQSGICASAPSLQFKGLALLQVDITPYIRVYLTQEECERYQKEGAKEFTRQISKVINLFAASNIPTPKEGFYQFLILPQGDIFKNITGLPFTFGITGVDGWMEVLAFDDSRFFKLNPDTYFIGLVHELAHLVHGDWIYIFPICEGFAENVPFYILNLVDEKQQEIALSLMPEEMYTVNTLIKRKMYIPEEREEIKGKGRNRVQYLRTYISMYLWMRGYLEILQQKYNLNKTEALIFVLEEFKKAAALPTLKKQQNYIAKLIDWKRKKVFDGKDLQIIGQKSLINTPSENIIN